MVCIVGSSLIPGLKVTFEVAVQVTFPARCSGAALALAGTDSPMPPARIRELARVICVKDLRDMENILPGLGGVISALRSRRHMHHRTLPTPRQCPILAV